VDQQSFIRLGTARPTTGLLVVVVVVVVVVN
jgi:hypothetical protein